MSTQTAAAPPSAAASAQNQHDEMARLKQALLHDIRRSVYVYRIDCGGCNACDIEIFAAITPVFDAERFGIKVVSSPRHADVILCTGAVTRAMRRPALRAYDAAPTPKIVIAFGACGCTGGIFHDLYCVWGGIDKILPVDVFIPGCPPTPAAAIYGFALALGMLGQKLNASRHVEAENEQVAPAHPATPLRLRVALEREARRMAGYRQGREIVEEFLTLSEREDVRPLEARVADFLARENDPRLSEIVHRLSAICTQESAGSGP
ncbi:MAG: NADH-quinone oxidoreductase subunit B family protein [Alphaproteobacteria bacterium]|nr:NADH-quinone oxidoreductase subunit B family protein [Alphaproteobacteria bacterium]